MKGGSWHEFERVDETTIWQTAQKRLRQARSPVTPVRKPKNSYATRFGGWYLVLGCF